MGALKEPKAPVGSHRATAPRAVSFEGWASAAAAGTPGPAPGPCRTQDGHDHVTPQDLDGAPGDEVEGCEQVPGVHQRVSGRCVRRLELHGQGPQAALGGPSEGLAVLQQRAVQVQTDVSLQALGEALQHLRGGGGVQRGAAGAGAGGAGGKEASGTPSACGTLVSPHRPAPGAFAGAGT